MKNSSETAKLSAELDSILKTHWRFGIKIIAIFAAVFLGWGLIAPLDSTVQAQGKIIPTSNTKVIQSQAQDGVITDILIKNGEHVEPGQILVKLSTVQTQAQYDNVRLQLLSTIANLDRLTADRDRVEEITFSEEVLSSQDESEVANFIANQKRLFAATTAYYNGKIEVMNEEIQQLHDRITGLKAQQEAVKEQLSLSSDYLTSLKKLSEQKLIERHVLLDVQGKVAAMNGQLGEIAAQVVQTLEEITKRQLEITNLEHERVNRNAAEMKEALDRRASLKEELRRLGNQAERAEIKSPISGVVHNLQYNTIGGVVSPGQPIMQIVPDTDDLIIEARLNSNNIDVVYVGQKAKIMFTAFKARFHPRIEGVVTYISPDVSEPSGPQAGMAQPYYTVHIAVSEEQLAKFNRDIKLTPGMPAVAFIVTGSRTFTEYFLAPIIQSTYRTFREE